MKRKIFILIFAAVIMLLALRFLTGEDSWVCTNGQWVKHGNPNSAMPTGECK